MSTTENRSLFSHSYTWLFLLTCFCCSLLMIRMVYWQNLFLLFLVWNLLLAWIPYCITRLLKQQNRLLVLLFAFPVWIFFFPNTFYIITDIFHLHQNRNVPLWYDLLVLFSAAWTGALLGFVSLYDMHTVLKRKVSANTSFIIVSLVLLASSFGVYLGRYIRWNSWDILLNPMAIARDSLYLLRDDRDAVAMTIGYSVFLLFNYCFLHQVVGKMKQQNVS